MPGESKASARRVQVALRRAQILKMKAAGAGYDDIWRAFPDDYRTRAAVIQDVQRALMSVVAEGAAELRALKTVQLDMLWVRAMQVLSRKHPAYSNGRVVYLVDPDRETGTVGVPLEDDGPVIQAIRELRMLNESYRKLHGLDAAQVVQVMTDDAIDAEIRRLTAELNAAAATQAESTAGTAGAEEEG